MGPGELHATAHSPPVGGGGGVGGCEKHAHVGVSDLALLLTRRWTEVDVSWCYWVSEEYYRDSIEYILQCARENEGSSATGADTE